MHLLKELLPSALALPVLGSLLAPAVAQNQLVTDTVVMQPTNWSDSLTVPRFDPSSGILLRVELRLEVIGQGTLALESLDASPSPANALLSTAIGLNVPGLPVLDVVATPALATIALDSFDGTIDFAGPSGYSSGNLVFGDNAQRTILAGGTGFAQFVGSAGNPGTITIPVNAAGSASGGGTSNLALSFTSNASAALQVLYVVDPDCNMNGIGDSVDIADGTSMDCNVNGIPDECDVPPDCNMNGVPDSCEPDCNFDGVPDVCEPDCNMNGIADGCEPDCNFNGQPDACDITNGTSLDDDGNGIPDECGLCRDVNRRRPGSLLLYPEFDNRSGVLSLVTVTNSSCTFSGGPIANDSIDVEFKYIDREGCVEFNRVETLTPCDTISVLTNFHNPDDEEGYLYVFAREHPGGEPISYNHLIGQVMILDGLSAFDFSVNAVSFASPLPQGAPTNLNGNNLRDLNGIEYEEAPNELLIPRFLGQCLPGQGRTCVESRLILINLTGGAAFDTTVDFLIYNDDEKVFSAEYDFRCWADPALASISNAFTNFFLQNSVNDPAEIIGAPTLESGWFRVNGSIARSKLATFLDPAIYAVLVERVAGVYSAADLPFEYCTQPNGALLARNLLGNL